MISRKSVTFVRKGTLGHSLITLRTEVDPFARAGEQVKIIQGWTA